MTRFVLNRLEHDGRATRGELLLDTTRLCYTLEDRYRPEKVKGTTRIPAGMYALELKEKGTSRFDASAARIVTAAGEAYHGMIRLKDVPSFTEILVHWGNYHTNTEGCILVGRSKMRGGDGALAVSHSRVAFAEVYPVLACEVLNGDGVIEIRDMDGSH